MKISEDGLNIIKKYEGFRANAYYCPAGVLTIGYGHTKGVQKCDIITHDEAEQILKEDIEWAESAINLLVKMPINQNQFDALTSFVFNLGANNFKSSTLLKKINMQDFSGAAKEFARWKFAGGKILNGLVKRRAEEAALFIKVDNLLI